MAPITAVTVAGNLTAIRRSLHPGGPGHHVPVRRGQPPVAGQGHQGVEESVSFLDVVCWRDLAENVALSLTKGSRVLISGRLEQRSWETDGGSAGPRSRSWPTTSGQPPVRHHRGPSGPAPRRRRRPERRVHVGLTA